MGVLSVDVAMVTLTHLFVESPKRLYGTWADNASAAPHALGEPNRLNVESPVLGVLSIVLTALLLAMLIAALVAFTREAVARRPAPAPTVDPLGHAPAA